MNDPSPLLHGWYALVDGDWQGPIPNAEIHELRERGYVTRFLEAVDENTDPPRRSGHQQLTWRGMVNTIRRGSFRDKGFRLTAGECDWLKKLSICAKDRTYELSHSGRKQLGNLYDLYLQYRGARR